MLGFKQTKERKRVWVLSVILLVFLLGHWRRDSRTLKQAQKIWICHGNSVDNHREDQQKSTVQGRNEKQFEEQNGGSGRLV